MGAFLISAKTGDRTPDLSLTKRLLYQLSYLGNKSLLPVYFTKNILLLHVSIFFVVPVVRRGVYLLGFAVGASADNFGGVPKILLPLRPWGRG